MSMRDSLLALMQSIDLAFIREKRICSIFMLPSLIAQKDQLFYYPNCLMSKLRILFPIKGHLI